MKPNNSTTIITQNEKMREILKTLGKLAVSDFSVLLLGETGTGKELFADFVHQKSSRWQKPLVKLGLTTMPADLMSSELFGYEKGAFTSANSSKKGLFEIADGGSIFLDDMDDVPLEIQPKLLRILESQELLRVGGLHAIPVDVRLIVASKVDLRELVESKMFRADLYYRINVYPVKIPPLRERIEDIPLLLDHFLKKFRPGKNIHLSSEALDLLSAYTWPGNIRELRNIAQRFCFITDEMIQVEHIPDEISQISYSSKMKTCEFCFKSGNKPYKEVMTCVEKQLFDQVLQTVRGNQTEAARRLGLSLSTFRDRLKRIENNGLNCSVEWN